MCNPAKTYMQIVLITPRANMPNKSAMTRRHMPININFLLSSLSDIRPINMAMLIAQSSYMPINNGKLPICSGITSLALKVINPSLNRLNINKEIKIINFQYARGIFFTSLIFHFCFSFRSYFCVSSYFIFVLNIKNEIAAGMIANEKIRRKFLPISATIVDVIMDPNKKPEMLVVYLREYAKPFFSEISANIVSDGACLSPFANRSSDFDINTKKTLGAQGEKFCHK